jgi:hypothetical protein
LTQRGTGSVLSTLQETGIQAGKAGSLRVVQISQLTGPRGDPTQQVDASTVDFPPLPVSNDPSRELFMQIAAELHRTSAGTLCKSSP